MEEGYVVKVTMYQGVDGRLTRNLKDAIFFNDEELATAAADLAGGNMVPVMRPERPVITTCPDSTAKSNQSWMRK